MYYFYFFHSIGLIYSHKILLGLIFSCFGDALLNHNYFLHGMAAFAFAQLSYIFAFGFKPLKLWIGLILYVICGASKIFYQMIVLSNEKTYFLFSLHATFSCFHATKKFGLNSFDRSSNLFNFTCDNVLAVTSTCSYNQSMIIAYLILHLLH